MWVYREMDVLKTVILISCVMGVVTTLADISLPEGTMKKQINAVMGIILILTAATPFMGKGFTLSLKSYGELSDTCEFGDISEAAQMMYLNEAETKLEEYFMNKLNTNGIEDVRIAITADTDECNRIEIKAVNVIAADNSDYERAAGLIREDLPETELTFEQEERIEIKE